MNAQQAINEVKQTIEVPSAIEAAWKEVWNARLSQKFYCDICDNQAHFPNAETARYYGWQMIPGGEFCPNHD